MWFARGSNFKVVNGEKLVVGIASRLYRTKQRGGDRPSVSHLLPSCCLSKVLVAGARARGQWGGLQYNNYSS